MNVYNKLKKEYLRFEDWAEYTFRRLCGRPTPLKRFITVLIIGGILAFVNIWFVVSSIYNMGKRDAEKEFLELQHIQTLELQHKNDSIKSIKN
jgi:hypothetical protein